MEESGGAELCGEARTIEKSSNLNCQGVVVNLGAPILGWAIRTCAFNYVTIIFEHCLAECLTSGEFTALVCTDNSVTYAILRHEGTKDGEGSFFRIREECPYSS